MATKSLVKKDSRDLIMAHLANNGSTVKWLSSKTGIKYSTLYFIIKRKERVLSDEKKAKINKILQTNY